MAGDLGEPKEARAPRPNGRPTGRPWQSLTSRVQIGIATAAVAVALVLGLTLFRASTAVGNLERSQYAQLATDARVRLERVVGRDRTRLMEAAFSDDLYGLMATGAAPPDSFIRPTFVERFVSQFGDRIVAIYDLSGRRMLLRTEANGSDLEAPIAVNGLFRTLDNREPTIGVIRDGARLIWVAGAPILPTNYADASQPIRGYVLVAQPFNPTLMTPTAGERGGRIELAAMEPSKQPFRTRIETLRGDSVRIDFTIPDVFAQQTTLASLITSRGEFQAVDGTLRNLLIGALFLIAAMAVGGWFATMRTLVTPAIKTSTLLAPVQQGQVPNLIGTQSSATEWSTLTGAVNRLLANGRLQNERFDRLTGAVSEGAWEHDLNSGDWVASPRFKQLIGYTDADFPTPLAALRQRIHPDDAASLIPWLSAETPPTKHHTAAIRIRRATGEETWVRLDATVATDLSGVPIRVTGRLIDIEAERQAAARILETEAAVAARVRGQGEFLSGLATSLRRDGDHRIIAHRLSVIGQALGRTLEIRPEPFDLHTLMQEVTDVPGLQVDLTIVPGVPARVNGPIDHVRTLLTFLVDEADRSTGKVVVRADQPNRSRPERIRLVVEDRRPQMAESELAALRSVLTTGEGPGPDPRLGWRLVHHLAAALGGSAGIEVDGPATALFVELPLEGVAIPLDTAPIDYGNEAESTWEPAPTAVSDGGSVTFDPPATPVELVADATVTIRFDDAGPALTPVSDRVKAALVAGDTSTLRLARIALADAPIRLLELRGAIRAGESRTVANITQALRSIADALESKPMANRCADILDAVESQYLETAEDLVTALEHAWVEAKGVIEPFAGAAAAKPTVASTAIDPATLEQLTATMTTDGLGLGNQLVSLFLAEAPGRLEGAERAIDRGELASAKSGIADLKGMCALVGATSLADRCSAFGAETDPTAAAATLGELRREYRRVQDTLEPLLGVRAGA